MTLKEIRILFAELSGRYDLINTDDSDNGLDWIIRKAQDYLDRHAFDHAHKKGKFMAMLANGDYFKTIPRCRFVDTVAIVNQSTDVKTYLDREYQHVLEQSYGKPVMDIDPGSPLYWYTPVDRIAANSADIGAIPPKYAEDIPSGTDVTVVMFIPGVDNDVSHLEVFGEFYSRTLTNDNDTSYWTNQHEDILLQACLYKLETFYRNSKGQADALMGLQESMKGLDFDIVAQSIAEVNQIAK